MKKSFDAIMFVFIINIVTYSLYNAGIITGTTETTIGTELDPDELTADIHPSGIIDDWEPSGLVNVPILGDLWNGFQFIINLLYWVVAGFPHMLTVWKVPVSIAVLVEIPMIMVVSIFFVEIILGRNTDA